MTASLSFLAAEAVSAYIDACGRLVAPNLDGLISTEAANYRAWRTDGYDWATVRAALADAWTARA